MNDREMMEHRVDQLRLQLADIDKEQLILNRSKRAVMDELLDTRRQLTREDILRNRRLEEEYSSAPEDLDFIH